MLKYLPYVLLIPFVTFSQDRKVPTPKHHFTVIAHRGNHQHAPENTYKAIEDAIALGVDYVEMDLRTTKDGVLINMHDATLKRMCGVDKKVKDLSFEEISHLKVRDIKHPEFGEHEIPTFKELLALCKGRTNIYLDFKEADVQKTFDLIKQAQMENAVVVYINATAQLEAWRAIAPQMPLIRSLPEKVKSASKMREILNTYTCDILDGNYKQYRSQTVKEAQGSGVPVWADIQSTSESERQWSKALKTGMTGLQTDHPEELIDYLTREGLR